MEDELFSKNQTTKALKQFNACRIFLQATFLSEMLTIDETILDEFIINNKTRKKSKSKSNLLWSN